MAKLGRLRVRLVLWTITLEAILLLTFAVTLLLFLKNQQDSQIEDALRLSGAQLRSVVETQNDTYVVPDDVIAQLNRREISVWILDGQGEVRFRTGEARNFDLPDDLPAQGVFRDVTLGGEEHVRLYIVPLAEADIVLAYSVDDSRVFLQQVAVGFAIAIPIMLLLSAGGGLFLANRALAPVTQITETARRINAEDLSRRIQMNLPDDEIGELAQTFNAMLDRLDRAFQRERQLTTDASHELRTPLGVLKMQLSLARSRPRETVELMTMMQAMEGDVDRMTRLVEQLLTLARVEQPGLMNFALCDIGGLLHDLGSQYQAVADEKAIQFTIFAEGDLTLPCDADKIRQAIANLMDNAIKYTSANGKIRLEAVQQSECIKITIADTGVGIAPEHLPHLFERFYRADSARTSTTGGFGLGLPITKAIVNAHGGQIEVHSELNVGTTISIILPISIPLFPTGLNSD
ncbi:MAG: two-component sensor histidine kinase [Chloroflexota bacterium]|nr:HAMP domain-containing protein [Chloroflexota bacterium]NOG66079.1 HAMP domain-containing protein [Chloroflexota bacterium]GIK63889.1 MAG: two-component sensor histidine kinase [Chloroflexota bacterium]